MIPTREDLVRKASDIPAPPVAIEAYWDGDTSGWFVVLTMLYLERTWKGSSYREFDLAAMRGGGGDLRIFNERVPPWPEAARAKEVGEELSSKYDVPFFFPSPNQPEDGCPRWRDRAQAYPCRRCGILLLQREPCPWRGVCFACHLAEKAVAKPGDNGKDELSVHPDKA